MLQKILVGVGAILAVIFFIIALAVYSFFFGSPLNDLGVNVLENKFYSLSIEHPADSELIHKKKYLGGNSLHGGGVCIFAVGESRVSGLSQTELKEKYKKYRINFLGEELKVKVLFPDSMEEQNYLPYVDWQGELYEESLFAPDNKQTSYVVYVSVTEPIPLFDYRCDD